MLPSPVIRLTASRDCWVSHSELPEKQTNKQANKKTAARWCWGCACECCLWSCPQTQRMVILWDTSAQAQFLKLLDLHMLCIILCKVSGVFCMWYIRLLLWVMGTLPLNKSSPAFSYKHSTDGNVWALLLLTRVCSGAFHRSQKYHMVTKVYFPFSPLYRMTQHLGTFTHSWALEGIAGNHYQ